MDSQKSEILENIEIGENKDIEKCEKNLSCKATTIVDDEPNSNTPWNYKILLLLRKIGKKTMGYRWMHEQDTKYYTKLNDRYNIYERLILAFIATITGAGFVSFLSGANLQNNKTIYIVISIIQLVAIFFAAIIKEYRYVNNYEEYKNDHSMAAVKNAEINLDIQYQLSLNVQERDADKYFLSNIIKRFNDVLYQAPKIREETKKKYLEESEDNDMFNPIITDDNGILQIVVHDKDEMKDKQNTDSKMKYQIDRWLQNF